MGVEFQSPEGLMVVSDSESESEGMPSAVGSPGCPPASPPEPGLVSSAGGLGPFRTPLGPSLGLLLTLIPWNAMWNLSTRLLAVRLASRLLVVT